MNGTGDEFDRLAQSLNAMLERIESLMAGLKEVSDNIAHDLKTPLTRLRNRAEEALRGATTEDEWRSALETTIEESDGLIRTFDALLMIARAEAGQARASMVEVDLADITENVAELYEPLADEQGLDLVTEIAPASIVGLRELLAQALSNLIDNANKYGVPRDGVRGRIVVSLHRQDGFAVLSVTDSGPGIPMPTGTGWWSASCGWRRAGRGRVRVSACRCGCRGAASRGDSFRSATPRRPAGDAAPADPRPAQRDDHRAQLDGR